MDNYNCYLLVNENNRTYIGITNNLEKRLKKHNNGTGAKSTRMYKNWRYEIIIRNLTKSDALKIEYKWKQEKGIINRIKNIPIK